jgi:hypothetical protein
MGKVIREYRLDIDYCACMVAIALCRHRVDNDNIGTQFSAETLSEELNLLPFSNGPNFNVNPLGLKHGFQMFGAYLKNVGIATVPMFAEDLYLEAFFQLESCQRSTEVKFNTFTNPSEDDSEATLLSAVMSIRDLILKKARYPISSHPSPSSVFGALYYSTIVKMNQPKPIPKIITRKSPSRLSNRAISNSADKLIASAECSFGEKHSLFYLESAVRQATKRKRKRIINNNDNDENNEVEYEENDDNEEHLHNLGEEEILLDPRVLLELSTIPAKYVIYSQDDKKNVTALYNVIKVVADERDYKNVNLVAAATTKQILEGKSYYANLSTRTIMRWVSTENTVSARPGRKISEDFENEVWGNLMLCIFEKNDVQVCNKLHCKLKYYHDLILIIFQILNYTGER